MDSEADVALHLDDGSLPADAEQINRQEARKLSVEPCIQSLVPACHCNDANCTALSCGQDEFVYTCNNCKCHMETRWHCSVCDDFDLCIKCKEIEGHGHPMEKLGFDLDDGSSPADDKQTNPQEAKEISIQRCIQSLLHACQCKGANCRLPSCQKMKRVVQHTKICKQKTCGGCEICKQLIAICCYHAKHCQETKCLVPYCPNIQHKLKQQQRLQQAQLLRRQVASMSPRSTGPVPAVQPGESSASNVAKTAGGAVKCGVSPTNLSSPHQAGIGLEPTTQTPPAHLLQEPKQLMQQQEHQVHPGMDVSGQMPRQAAVIGGPVDQVPHNQVGPANKQALGQLMATLRSPSTPEQQGQILQILKSNPPLMAAFIKQRQLQIGQHGGEVGPLRQNPGMDMSGQMPRQADDIGGPVGQVPHNQVGPANKQALGQLMATLRSPITPEQEGQILQILKSNPPLLAAFIKQRQLQIGQQGGEVGPLRQNPGMDMGGRMPRQADDIGGPVGQVPQNEVGPANKQALQQLMAILGNPSTLEQQQRQILQILESNPPLRAALIKQREQQQQNTFGVQHMMAQQQQHSQQHQQQSTMQILQSQQGQLVGSHGGPKQQHQQQQEQQSQQGQSQGQQVPLTDAQSVQPASSNIDEMQKTPGVEQETLQESQQPEKDESSS